MKSKSDDMKAIFNALSEKNKDIVILVARSVKVAQNQDNPPHKLIAQSIMYPQENSQLLEKR